jgi:RimJ/RimL family protein N-acetyltransferase
MKVIIRPLQQSDAYISYKWRNDPEVFKYTGTVYRNEIFLDTELNWINKVIQNKDEYRCAILVDDVYVGNIYLTGITTISADYHIFIGNKDYWGKGVAKKASELILRYAFDDLKLKIVKLRVNVQNIKALQLYEGLGFVKDRVENNRVYMSINNLVLYGK